MAEFNFILESFGLQHMRPKIFASGEQLKSGNSDFSKAGLQTLDAEDFSMNTTGKELTSMLGTPVFTDMILKTVDAPKKSIQLLWVLADVNMEFNIVKTKIQGRDGSVKEYISEGDHSIKIRGALYSDNFGDLIQKRKLRCCWIYFAARMKLM